MKGAASVRKALPGFSELKTMERTENNQRKNLLKLVTCSGSVVAWVADVGRICADGGALGTGHITRGSTSIISSSATQCALFIFLNEWRKGEMSTD